MTPPPLGTLGQKLVYALDGAIEYSQLVWEHGANPVTAFARSSMAALDGEALEYWIQLKGRRVELTADVELMDGDTKTCPDLFTASALANQIEIERRAIHKANPALFYRTANPSPRSPDREQDRPGQ